MDIWHVMRQTWICDNSDTKHGYMTSSKNTRHEYVQIMIQHKMDICHATIHRHEYVPIIIHHRQGYMTCNDIQTWIHFNNDKTQTLYMTCNDT